MGARRNNCKGAKLEVPQRGPGAKRRWESGGEEADGILLKMTYTEWQTSFSVHWHHLQHERFLLHNPNFVVNFFKGNTSLVTHKWLSGNFSTLQKFFWSSCGGPIFVGAPVRPNMLNMPKSASGQKSVHSGNGLPLLALRHLVSLPVSTPLRIVNRCWSCACKWRYINVNL